MSHDLLVQMAYRPFAAFAAGHSRGTKSPCWREKVALGQDRQRNCYHLKLCMSYVCLVPMRLLLSSVAVLYHMNG